MTGLLLSRYVDDLDMYEAQKLLMMAQAASMQYAKKELWDQIIDRAMGQDRQETFTFLYEGKPVSTAGLKSALAQRWGTGFEAD